MTRTSVKFQYFATIIANLLTIGYGATCGWTSPSFLLLCSDESPLPSGKITMEDASWIAALICVGGLLGNLFFGLITNKFGRKIPLMTVAIPQILGWLFILYAQNLYYLYVARILAGFAGGGVFVILPLYVAEIADDRIRGTLGSMLVLFCNIGIIFAFVFGNYCSYEFTPKFIILLTAVFVCVFYFFPESPSFLLKQNRIQDTEKSIRFYRSLNENSDNFEFLQCEVNKLKNRFGSVTDKYADDVPLKWSDFTAPESRKALTIGFGLIALSQFCGCFAMLNYAATIFKESGSSLSPNMSAIVVGVIQLLGAYVSTNLVDRAGRKFLITTSATGTALGLVCLGTYFLLKSIGFELESFSWMPVSSFSFVIFIASWGVITLPYLVIAEIMPEKLKNFGSSFCMSVLWIFAFIMIKYLPLLSGKLGMHGIMYLFAACSFSGALFMAFVMPETKGKSFNEIMELLSKSGPRNPFPASVMKWTTAPAEAMNIPFGAKQKRGRPAKAKAALIRDE